MDRNRDARRSANLLASSTGIARRRHRTNSHRDSPDEDGAVELQESLRLRDRVKKDRDRDRDRERDNRERDRERSTIRSSKRRRAERMMIHGSARGGGDDGGGGGGGGGEDTSEESVNDEEEDEGDNNNNHHHPHHHHHKSGSIIGSGGGGGVRLMPPIPNNNNNNSAASAAAVAGISPAVSNHYHNGHINSNNSYSNSNTNHNHHHHQQHQQHSNLSQVRKNFPPTGPPKVVPTAPVLKFGDEMIGVSVPRKARSASTKRSHDWMSSSTAAGGVGMVVGEHLNRQTSISPARPSLVTAPLSPSSSNISAKKLKPSSSKQLKPPKSSSLKSSSGNPEELEIEIAEVLFGLKTQPQPPPKKVSNDSAEINRSSSDAKSRVSSPMSNSPNANIQSSPAPVFPPNSCSSACSLTAVAPKRKKPRPVSEIPGGLSVRSSPTTTKIETLSSISEKNPGSGVENGHGVVNGLSPVPETVVKKRKEPEEESKPVAEGLGESPDVISKKEVVSSPKRESPVQEAAAVDENSREDVGLTVTALSSLSKGNSGFPDAVTQREEKFLIDLEASPPQLKTSSSERDDVKVAIELKPVVDAETKSKIAKEDEKLLKLGKVDADGGVGGGDKKVKGTVEESEGLLKKVEINKGKNVVDLEKPERDNNNNNNGFVSKLADQSHKHQQHLLPPSKSSKGDFQIGQSNALPLTMSSWPGGLPQMGYMTPMPVVTMDGSTISPAPVQPVFSLPKPKRCATHCYIARNIHRIQQVMAMNPFWQAASFGTKPCNISGMPQMDLPGNLAPQAVINAPDRAPPGLAIMPGQVGKDKSSQAANVADSGQRKQQILLQQTMPHVPPNSMLGPTFIFPINQQQAAVAASARPGMAVKHPATSTSGGLASSGAPNAASAASASPTAGGGGAGQGPAVSFSYPNMPAGYETQYLAILQNNYPFPIPAVGAAPQNYRGTHPQPLPFLNGSFYPSQIIHPSQLQQSQQQQQSVSQSHQMQHHQHTLQNNSSLPSNSSSSQKHMQQQRQGGTAIGSGNGGGNLQNFPAAKSSRQLQQSQPHQSHQSSARQVENEGPEDSSSTGDSRGGNRVPQNMYAQNFVMPMHHQNYAMMASPAALASVSATSSGSNHNHNNDKRQQQQQHQHQNQHQHVQPQPQQQAVKTTTEPLPQAFAMSFAPVNGATNNAAPGYDLSSLAQNNAILQSLPEATRQNIQMMAMNAAQVLQSQQRKNLRISDDGRTRDGADSAHTDDDRKVNAGMSSVTAGQSIAFSRSELSDASVSASLTNNLNDSSTRPSNLGPGSSWTARSSMPNSQSQQVQHHHHQQQQMMQIHKQQQQQLAAASSARSKTQGNINVFPEHMSSTMTSSAAKFPNGLSGFPQSLVQTGSNNNSSQIQSPQWRNPARPSTTAQSPSQFVSSSSSLNKTHHHHQQQQQQQQGRTPQAQTQISFGSNQKPTANLQGQPLPSSSQSPSSPMLVGSPSSSSMSRGAGGSPRNAPGSAAHNSKNTSVSTAQVSSLSSQHAKNSSLLGQKNVPSILGNPHVSSSSSSANKSQLQQQAQQAQQAQQLQKNLHQAQLFFSNPYVQSQIQNFSSTNSNPAGGGGGGFPNANSNAAGGGGGGGGGGFPNTNSNAVSGAGNYMNRNQPQTQQQLGAVSTSSSSSGILSLCPVSLAASGTTDPAKAIAAATSTMKGSNNLPPSHGILNGASQHQISPASFAYVHSVPAAVQVKSSSDQKQPAGNDNLHASWQPEKK